MNTGAIASNSLNLSAKFSENCGRGSRKDGNLKIFKNRVTVKRIQLYTQMYNSFDV